MNKYYANIINQMGYWIMNENPMIPQLFYKDSNDPVKMERKNDSWCYEDRDIWDNHKSIKINSQGRIDCKLSESLCIHAYDDSPDIYNVMINGIGGSSVTIIVSGYPLNDKNTVPVKINVIARFGLERVESMTIEQNINYATLSYNSEKVKKLLSGVECTRENYVNLIADFISSIKYTSNNKDVSDMDMCMEVLEGLKILIPSLGLSINDALNYWKTYAIPKALSLKVAERASLQSQQERDEKNFAERMVKLNSEIYDLQNLSNDGKKTK